jgi:predicted metalloprotease with PDZ domain
MQPTVTLFVGAGASADAMVRDWTAVHELAHLLVADVDDEDAWLGEGLATYYEEVLRAREGLLTETEAWSAIARGLERGRAGCTGTTIREAARTMHASQTYACVYWGGAAIALLADVAYRSAGSSLDAAIASAWPHRAEHASEGELTEWLDAGPHGTLATIAAGALDRDAFPDLAATFADLGIEVVDDHVVLHDDAPHAALRRAIVNGPLPLPSTPSSCAR